MILLGMEIRDWGLGYKSSLNFFININYVPGLRGLTNKQTNFL